MFVETNMEPYSFNKQLQTRAPHHSADSLIICFDCASGRANYYFSWKLLKNARFVLKQTWIPIRAKQIRYSRDPPTAPILL